MRFPGRRVLYALGKPRVPPGFRQSKPGMGINRIPFGLGIREIQIEHPRSGSALSCCGLEHSDSNMRGTP